MFRLSVLIAVVFCIGLTWGTVCAQDAGQRAQGLVAALDKTKYKKKEKRDFAIEIYIDIRNEAAVKSSANDYAGQYESEDSGYRLDLQVSAGAAVTGSGYDTIDSDNGRTQNFTLKDARIDGALLTAVKVYENGETHKFEAVFVNRTISSGKNANDIATRDTKFGLGFIERAWPVISESSDKNEVWTNRVFLERK